MRGSDKAHIQAGEFEATIDKYGCIVNAPLITVWSEQAVQDYIKFLERLLPHLEK